jgi:hypothetical protein
MWQSSLIGLHGIRLTSSRLIRIRALRMRDRRAALVALVVLSLLASPAGAQAPAPSPADLVVLNGRVITVDPAFRVVAATRRRRSSSARTRASSTPKARAWCPA